MRNNLAELLNQSYKKGYDKGHLDCLDMMLDLSVMAFCVSMNDQLGIGAERYEKVLKQYIGIIKNDVMEDYEHARSQLERRFVQITGQTIQETIKHV